MSRWRLLLPIGYSLLILAVSSIPADAMPDEELIWRWDKLVHGLEYAVLGALWIQALRAGGSRPWRCAMLAVALAAGWGLLDEWYQSTVPGRDSSWGDVFADFVGACFGALLAIVLYSRREKPDGDYSKLR